MRHRQGFTLIEVIGATAAFVVAFLAGTAAFTRLLHHEMANYHRALAGVAAIRWARDAGSLDDSPRANGDALFSDLSDKLFIRPDTEMPSDGANWSIKIYYGESTDLATAVFLGRYHRPTP